MEIKYKHYLLLLIISLMFCCKKKKAENQYNTYTIFNDTIPKKKKRVKTLKLKSSVQKKMDGSQNFAITKEYIDSLNVAPFSQIDDIAYILNEQLEELPRELDSTLTTKGVLSRIKQIETFSRAINFEVSKQHRDTAKINNHAVNVIESFNSLVIQLNEASTRLPEDIEKQLEKTTEFTKDTIVGTPLF